MTSRRAIALRVAPLAVLMAGCALKPEPVDPPPPTPPAWREPVSQGAWPSRDWWSNFGSTELDSLVTEAEKNNEDLAAAEARVHQADAQAKIAGAALLPSVTAGAAPYATQHLSPAGRERRYQNFSGVIQASYEIDFWGKNHAARNAARSEAKASAYDRQVVDMTIVSGVATTYFQLLSLREQLTTAEANVTQAKKLLTDVKDMEQGGLATETEVVQQQSVVDTVSEQIAPLREQEAHALDALAILVGENPESLQVKAQSLAGIKIPTPVAGLPSELLTHRPDVQADEQRLAAARANITVARAQFLPSFNLSATAGVEAMAMGGGMIGPELLYNMAFSAMQPIFEGGRLTGQLHLSQSQKAEMLADYIQSTRQAYADVEDALASVNATNEEEQTDQRALDEADASVGITKTSNGGGIIGTMPVQSAYAATFPGRMAVVQAHTARLQSMVSLYRALGGGWKVGA
ncbi:MAG TPA: efflux transporter outer membrane subunit [Caulobacteraceae bacterium]|jgi:NodT family efflux transporter outer membrane factor (OMF) lipoprotein